MVDYEKIARQLDKLVCKDHQQRVTTIVTDTDADPIFRNCCCVGFEEELFAKYNELIEEAIERGE